MMAKSSAVANSRAGWRGWRTASLQALPVATLMLALFSYWFAVADRYAVFLYDHDMGPLYPDTSPFSRVTSSRYWMTGLVVGGMVMVAYAAANWLLGRVVSGYRPPAWDEREAPHTQSVALGLLLTIFTFGIYNLYWNWRQMRSCNQLLERRAFSWPFWLVFSILTFGIYHLYYQFKMGAAINEIQDRLGFPVTEGLPVLSLVAALLGFGVVADCIHQHELNRIDDQAADGAAL